MELLKRASENWGNIIVLTLLECSLRAMLEAMFSLVSSVFVSVLLCAGSGGHAHKTAAAAAAPASHAALPAGPRGICGDVERSVTWKGPLLRLRGSLRIPKDKELWLEAGTRVQIPPSDSCRPGGGPVEIVVEGRLVVEGNAWQPVLFEPESGFWAGIRVLGSVRMDYARIETADRGLWFHGGDGEVRSTLISGCVIGVRTTGGATPRLSNLLITHSLAAGLRVETASPRVEGCLFVDNRGVGAWFAGTGLTNLSRNAFWNNLLGDVQGSGQWGNFRSKKGLLVDAHDNLRCDPVFAGSPRDLAWKDSLRAAMRRPPDPPFGMSPYSLSTLSPLRGKGPRLPGKPWKKSDIGLYGLDAD